jgi:ATP-dependent helicase HrpB
LAAPVTIEQIEQHAAELIQERETVQWDEQAQAVVARRRRSLDAIVLSETAVSEPDSDMVREAMLAAIRRMGISALPWTADLRQWQARVLLLRRTAPEAGWPDVGDERLLDTLESWLGPILHGMTRLHDLRRIGLSDPLHALLSWEQRRDLDLQAPTHLTVPTGSRIRLDYIGHDYPVLAVRLQEMFGARDTPRVAYGHVPVTISLLSPAGRPVQVTQDLAGFWRSSYHDVRKELRGRYPKHHWPENPLTATPTRRTKPRER